MSDIDPNTLDGISPEGQGDDAEEAYAGVGNELRLVRVSAGEDLDGVSVGLRIRRVHLEAIEEGRFADLPGPVYALGFIRSYAEYLGLDGDQAIKLFKEEERGFKARTKLSFPSPAEEGNLPRAALIVFSLIVAGAVWGVWQYRASIDRSVVAAVSEVPERLAALVDQAGEKAAQDAPPEEAAPATTDAPTAAQAAEPEAVVRQEEPAREPAPVEETAESPPAEVAEAVVAEPAAAGQAALGPDAEEIDREPVEETPRIVAAIEPPPPPAPALPVAGPDQSMILPAPPRPEPAAAVLPPRLDELMPSAPPTRTAAREPVPAAPAPPPVAAPSAGNTGGYVPRTYGASNKDFRVVLRAQHDSWVQIQGANNELVLTRMLRAGDTYLVPDRDDLIMMTGNAGGLEIVVDGRAVPRMGPEGAVRRNISLAAERLLALAAADER